MWIKDLDFSAVTVNDGRDQGIADLSGSREKIITEVKNICEAYNGSHKISWANYRMSGLLDLGIEIFSKAGGAKTIRKLIEVQADETLTRRLPLIDPKDLAFGIVKNGKMSYHHRTADCDVKLTATGTGTGYIATVTPRNGAAEKVEITQEDIAYWN